MTTTSSLITTLQQSRIAKHICFWIAVVVLLAYHGSLYGGQFKNNLINMLVMLPVQMMAAYLLIYVQVPKWLFKGHWVLFTMSLLTAAYFLAVLARWSIIYIAEPFTRASNSGYNESLWEIISDPLYLIQVYVITVYLPALALFLYKLTRDRSEQENRLVHLAQEKQATELNFLKAQMNPHFLFNTLNNIYSLSKSNSEQTSEMILKLSELLDYTIYECRADRVPIYKEWQLIENYIDLESIRHEGQMMIVIDEQIDNEDAPIAPLILISLVENAFKHALNGVHEAPNIKLQMKEQDGVLSFELFNTKSASSIRKNEMNKGVGFQNVQRQLALQYPDRHRIKINDLPESYEVILSIEL